jgi:hypothetical protein
MNPGNFSKIASGHHKVPEIIPNPAVAIVQVVVAWLLDSIGLQCLLKLEVQHSDQDQYRGNTETRNCLNDFAPRKNHAADWRLLEAPIAYCPFRPRWHPKG